MLNAAGFARQNYVYFTLSFSMHNPLLRESTVSHTPGGCPFWNRPEPSIWCGIVCRYQSYSEFGIALTMPKKKLCRKKPGMRALHLRFQLKLRHSFATVCKVSPNTPCLSTIYLCRKGLPSPTTSKSSPVLRKHKNQTSWREPHGLEAVEYGVAGHLPDTDAWLWFSESCGSERSPALTDRYLTALWYIFLSFSQGYQWIVYGPPRVLQRKTMVRQCFCLHAHETLEGSVLDALSYCPSEGRSCICVLYRGMSHGVWTRPCAGRTT